MKQLHWQAALCCIVLAACQRSTFARSTLAVDGRVVEIVAGSRTPSALLTANGISFSSDDALVNNGVRVDFDKSVPPSDLIHLELIRARPVLINGNPLLTSAGTVGEAIKQSGINLYAADTVDPPAETPIAAGMIISIRKAVAVHASVDGTLRPMQTSSSSMGSALADAGMPLEGLDLLRPSESGQPADRGEVGLVRVTEAVVLSQEPLPYQSVIKDSAELELGIEQVLQPGTAGLVVSSTRIRLADGAEISKETGARTVVTEPQDRTVLRGTKIIERTETVDGLSVSYWRKLQMYATVYSPCNSGTGDGACSSGTASGRPAGKGVVAVDPSLFSYLNGQRLYIPGYGFAVIGDVGGGYIIEETLGISRYKWIDLGFDDNNIQDMTGWLSVYFLAPAPAVVPDVLR